MCPREFQEKLSGNGAPTIIACFASKKSQSLHIVALIWHTILQITKVPVGVTQDIIQCISKTSIALGLPEVNLVPHGNQSLTFEFAFPGADTEGLHIGLSFREFQLLHAGPFLDRNMVSALDSRVRGFAPDRWQREILDQIDAKASLFCGGSYQCWENIHIVSD